jgi:putative ABC transport system permease protein
LAFVAGDRFGARRCWRGLAAGALAAALPLCSRSWSPLGATPQQVSSGLSAAQVLPALAGAILGIAGGLALFAAVSGDETANPPLWQLLAVVPVTVLVVAALTTIPARLGARRPAAEILQAELA